MRDVDSPLAGTEMHHLRSRHVDETFKVFVGHCGEAVGAEVLLLRDANGFFGLTVDVVRALQLSQHLPPLLVVGVGYDRGGLADTIDLRTRDLTPTEDPAYAELFPTPVAMGGADRLRDFVASELLPWVGDRFGAGPRATYFGHSFGGLFGLHVLLTAPQTFRRYVLGSPSLWWHDHVLFEREAAWAARHDDLVAEVFTAVGAQETDEGRAREASPLPADEAELAGRWYIDMVGDLHELVGRLLSRSYPGLRLTAAVFDDEMHISVPALVLTRGLRTVFGAPR